jgi:[acyl-carrier-protein] S-malonyltransferase
MQPAAEKLAESLANIEIRMPEVSVLHNQNASPAQSVDEIRERLKLQLFQPVLWVDCVNAMHTEQTDVLIEFGPGKVLTGLTRRINKAMSAYAVFDQASFEKTQQTLAE